MFQVLSPEYYVSCTLPKSKHKYMLKINSAILLFLLLACCLNSSYCCIFMNLNTNSMKRRQGSFLSAFCKDTLKQNSGKGWPSCRFACSSITVAQWKYFSGCKRVENWTKRVWSWVVFFFPLLGEVIQLLCFILLPLQVSVWLLEKMWGVMTNKAAHNQQENMWNDSHIYFHICRQVLM